MSDDSLLLNIKLFLQIRSSATLKFITNLGIHISISGRFHYLHNLAALFETSTVCILKVNKYDDQA